MAEPRTRVVVSSKVRATRKAAKAEMPLVFAKRTRLIVLLAVNGATLLMELPGALGVTETASRFMHSRLIEDKICIRQSRRTFDGPYKTKFHRLVLDLRHPAAGEMAAVGRALGRHFPVPKRHMPKTMWVPLQTAPIYGPDEIDALTIFHPQGMKRTRVMLLIRAAGEIQVTGIIRAKGSYGQFLNARTYANRYDSSQT